MSASDEGQASRRALVNVITLGARDVARLADFYRSLGWREVIRDENFAAFGLTGGVIALFALDDLAADALAEPAAQSGIRCGVEILVSSPDEVDALVERWRAHGGTVTKHPVDATFFEGRSAYVADPEGNFFEVAWAPPDNPIVRAAIAAAREAVDRWRAT